VTTRDIVASKIAAFQSIYIPYPPQLAFHERCAFLVELGRATRGRPQKGMRVLAPSGSGKTAAAEAFIRQFEAAYPPTERFVPIIHVPLDRATTTKKLMMSILDAFGDSYSSHGNEKVLKARVKLCFERFGTLLMIIDEVQHLNFHTSATNDATDTLKRLLDDGVVPIIFMGTEDALDMFTRNIQLSSRLIEACDLSPLDWTLSDNRQLLVNYVAALDAAMVRQKIIAEHTKVIEPWAVGCLHTVTGGVIGRVSRLFGIALDIALRRDATRIEIYDLSLAVDRWAVPNGIIAHNPFLKERGQ
jgi:acylphosphatase